MTAVDNSFQDDLYRKLAELGASVGRAKSGNLLRVDTRTCENPPEISLIREILQCPALRELCVRGVQGLDQLAEQFLNLPKLKMLDVEATDFSDESLRIVAGLPDLDVVNVRATRVTSSLVTQLRKQMVGTRIIGP